MSFDKKEYWDNRSKGVRGQGHTVKPAHTTRRYGYGTHVTSPSKKPLGRYAIRKNTKRARLYEAQKLEGSV